MAYCSQCGSELQNGICPNGHPVRPPSADAAPYTAPEMPPAAPLVQEPFSQPTAFPPAPPPEASQSPPPKKSKAPKVILIILIVLVLGVLGLVLLGMLGTFLFFALWEDEPPQSAYVAPYVVSEQTETMPTSEPLPTEEPLPAQTVVLDEEALIAMLQESSYATWHTYSLPEDITARNTLLNADGWNVNCGVISMAMWANGIATSNVSPDQYFVTDDDIQATAASFYGIDNIQIRSESFQPAPGEYTIPAHGPMHRGDLLLETLTTSGNRFSVETLITVFDDYGDGATEHYITLLNTFEANPEGAHLPFRLVSIEELSSTIPLHDENIVPPANLYDAPILVEVDVLELNLREGPGTDYEVITILDEGQLLEIIGYDDTGEWVCSYSGWVSAEYLHVLDA